MALERGSEFLSFPAAGDLSAAQFKIVKAGAGGEVALAGGTADTLIGVLYNKPKAQGEGAQVTKPGMVCRAVAGGSIAPGAWVTSNAQGFAVAGTAGHVVGIAVSAEATGSADVFELLVAPGQI